MSPFAGICLGEPGQTTLSMLGQEVKQAYAELP
jgi:hypothetical protein